MNPVRRAWLCVPAVTGLVWATVLAESAASASVLVGDSHDVAALERAVARAPADPELHELLALSFANDVERASGPEQVRELKQALAMRPISPYTWANLAAAQYRAGVTGETFQVALERASQLGPNEPAVQGIVALYGLAVLDEVRPQTRAAIGRMLAAGMKSDPAAMLQIAQRRGRLDVACHYVDASRLAGDLSKLCNTRGAIQ